MSELRKFSEDLLAFHACADKLRTSAVMDEPFSVNPDDPRYMEEQWYRSQFALAADLLAGRLSDGRYFDEIARHCQPVSHRKSHATSWHELVFNCALDGLCSIVGQRVENVTPDSLRAVTDLPHREWFSDVIISLERQYADIGLADKEFLYSRVRWEIARCLKVPEDLAGGGKSSWHTAMSQSDYARLIGCDRSQVCRYVAGNEYETRQHGNRVQFKKADIELLKRKFSV